MASFQSDESCNALKPNQDFISNLPNIAIDKILKRLPIKTVAKMSILSTKWRQSWLTLKHLVFGKDFWDKRGYLERDKFFITSCIISNVLLHHVGPVHKFYLYIPKCKYDLNVSPWLSSLSKFGVKKIIILLKDDYSPIPSNIFDCKDLAKLKMNGFSMNRVPSNFKGFAYLECLDLVNFMFEHDVFRSLIANCPLLTVLKLAYVHGIDHLVIDVPNLEHLSIVGDFETINFKNAPRLSFLSLRSNKDIDIVNAKEADRFIEFLSSSCQLQHIHFAGYMYKYFGAGWITNSPTLMSLHRLRLMGVDLNNYDGLFFTLGMVQCCPFIKDLHISVLPKDYEVEHEFDYDKNYELEHLVKVKITGLRGSKLELKLIEYLLAISTKLEELAFICFHLDPISELKMTRKLLELARASPKAKVVCLDK